MPSTAKLTATMAALILATTVLAGCAATTTPQAAEPTATPSASPTPTPTYLDRTTEMGSRYRDALVHLSGRLRVRWH